MKELLKSQYRGVQGARGALFTYLATMHPADLSRQVAAFNNSTIKSLLVHVGNTYLHWLTYFPSQVPISFFKEDEVQNVDDLRARFGQVDEKVIAFIDRYGNDPETPLQQYPLSRKALLTLTPLELFTHAITHEFHHKGQVLTMSRLLGHIPVDTDVIRT